MIRNTNFAGRGNTKKEEGENEFPLLIDSFLVILVCSDHRVCQ